MLELYLKLVFALFSGAAGLEFLNVAWTTETLIIATLILGVALLFGETVYFAMVGARKWHAEYVNVHLLIQAALVKQDFSFSPELVPAERRHPFLPSLYTSRAFILVQLCNASIIMLAGGLWFKSTLNPLTLVVSGASAVVLFLLNMVRGNRILKQAEQEFWKRPGSSWIIASLTLEDYKNRRKDSDSNTSWD
ncbi:hypothetical protein Adeg_0701 [Ammonifex degensii KC4]|uniref:Uncharacterized protein n=1 Tax=Ammonifex degensii (strain DSM 10501 / KC4) TaxID=429009 RepID=C9RC71_AMMDK|nr:hypothetical protein [Ammonifex degensii]ACX51848.1 hypothetical protein Adeg_0701 [Ammonifex degensii KC4]